jgi:hypothetical protein
MRILVAKLGNGEIVEKAPGRPEDSFRATMEKSQRISKLPAPEFFYIEKDGDPQRPSNDT